MKTNKWYKAEEVQDALFTLWTELAMVERAHQCIYYTSTVCTLHNTPCKDHTCQDYWSKYSLPLEEKGGETK